MKAREMNVPVSNDVKKEDQTENETSSQLLKKLSNENKPTEVLPQQLSVKDVQDSMKEFTKAQKEDSLIPISSNNNSNNSNVIQLNAVNNNNNNNHSNTQSQPQSHQQSNQHSLQQSQVDAVIPQKINVHLIITEKTQGLFTNQSSSFKINEFGLEGNAKTTHTNFIFFGLDESNSKENLYDVVMDIGTKNHDPTELFYILYENNSKNYILKSLTKEFFFSNVIVPYQQIILEDHQKNYFKIGKVIISIYPRFSDESIELIVKKGETISVKQRLTFTKGKFPVAIGRANCSVNLACDSLSKSHASIDYDMAHHRFFFIDNASTNGSQMLLNKGKNLRLSGEQTFNINDRLFTIKENFK